MKIKLALLFVFGLAFFSSRAQIGQLPNENFNSWTVSQYAPDGWSTYESLFDIPLGHTFKDSSDGSYAVGLISDSFPVFDPSAGVAPGLLSVGAATTIDNVPTFPGYAYTYRPDTIWFDYKYTSPGTDTALMVIQLIKDGKYILFSYTQLDTVSQWTPTYVIIDSSLYFSTANPDTIIFQFYSSNVPQITGSLSVPVKGSTLVIDNVSFSVGPSTSGLQSLATQIPLNIYPNPVSDLLIISSSKDISGYNLTVFDMTGRVVARSTLEGNKPSVDVRMLANGTYLYNMVDKAGNLVAHDKFTVLR